MFFKLPSFFWSLAFHYYKNKFAIKVAITPEEKEKIFKFRYQIYRKELSHVFLDDKGFRNETLYDELDFAENTFILYSGDINHITGTIRMTVWDKHCLPLTIKEKYFIEDNILNSIDSIGELRFFQVHPHYRKTFLALTLISYLYQYTNEHPKFLTDITFCDCQPGLLPYYLKTGCFTYTNQMVSKEFDILQVPLAITQFDIKFLKDNHCINYYLVKRLLQQYRKKISDKASLKKIRDFNSIIPHLSITMTPAQIIHYRNNITDEALGKRYDLITSLLSNLLLLSLKKDIFIIKKDLMDYDLYLLVEGTIGVYIGETLIAELSPGTLFGEMALLDEKHRRFADAKSLTDVKVILISRNLLFTLEKNKPHDAIKLLHIISNSLSSKLAVADEVISGSKKASNLESAQ